MQFCIVVLTVATLEANPEVNLEANAMAQPQALFVQPLASPQDVGKAVDAALSALTVFVEMSS